MGQAAAAGGGGRELDFQEAGLLHAADPALSERRRGLQHAGTSTLFGEKKIIIKKCVVISVQLHMSAQRQQGIQTK